MSEKIYQIIDLYAGAGGLSLGAARAGFQVRAAVELDAIASDVHALNFPKTKHITEDVAKLRGRTLLDKAGVSAGSSFGLIGGPPCQGFSEAGYKSASDPRNRLLAEFFRLVAETRPAFYLAENVPGLVEDRNKAVLEAALAHIPKEYTQLKPITVKANEYGAPTRRTRVFFYGYDPNRVGTLNESDFAPNKIADVRVKHALTNLPRVRADWQREDQSWRAVGSMEDSEYARQIQDRIPADVGDRQAIELYKRRRIASGFLGTRHSKETVRRFSALRYGERDSVSKATRLDPEGYCRTLLAGTGPERGSFQGLRPIHPDSPRVIAPREAARLQGFPDWFQFHPTKWHAFRQLGNSVSPIIAEYLLAKIYRAMS